MRRAALNDRPATCKWHARTAPWTARGAHAVLDRAARRRSGGRTALAELAREPPRPRRRRRATSTARAESTRSLGPAPPRAGWPRPHALRCRRSARTLERRRRRPWRRRARDASHRRLVAAASTRPARCALSTPACSLPPRAGRRHGLERARATRGLVELCPLLRRRRASSRRCSSRALTSRLRPPPLAARVAPIAARPPGGRAFGPRADASAIACSAPREVRRRGAPPPPASPVADARRSARRRAASVPSPVGRRSTARPSSSPPPRPPRRTRRSRILVGHREPPRAAIPAAPQRRASRRVARARGPPPLAVLEARLLRFERRPPLRTRRR